MTPTARTLRWLESHGYYACTVERYCSFTKRRHDAFSFGDILAFPNQPFAGTVVALVQATSGSNVSGRIAKIRGIGLSDAWLSHEGRAILVFGWAKRGPRGKRKLWTPKIVRVLPGGIIEPLTPSEEPGAKVG